MKIDEIETPALLLDMDAMESNLGKMAAFFSQSTAKLRPHFKNHKCPALALRQLAAGAIGMTCATVAEAESLVRHGVRNVLIANEIADPIKIGHFIDLARQADVMVCVDNEAVVEAIAKAARSQGIQPSVLVDVDVGLHRCGVQPGEPAVRLARVVVERGLRFRGLMGYEGRVRMHDGPEELKVCSDLPRFCGRICTSTTRGWAGWPDSRSVTSAVGVRPAGGDGIGKLACSHPHYRSYHGTPRTSVRQWPPDAVLCRPKE
jgi:D-serine deaminase-like pyridoxal phosphate-dependent protein